MGTRRSDIDWAVFNKFGANLRRERRLKGWTVEKLAEKSGLTDRKIRRIEAGEIMFTIRFVDIFMLALGCKAVRLMSGFDNLESATGSGVARSRRLISRTQTAKKRRLKKP